jgi:hypothetical protein
MAAQRIRVAGFEEDLGCLKRGVRARRAVPAPGLLGLWL